MGHKDHMVSSSYVNYYNWFYTRLYFSSSIAVCGRSLLRVCFAAPITVGPPAYDPLSPVCPLLPPIISVREVRKERKERRESIGVCTRLRGVL
jgi:hypothetical protein